MCRSALGGRPVADSKCAQSETAAQRERDDPPPWDGAASESNRAHGHQQSIASGPRIGSIGRCPEHSGQLDSAPPTRQTNCDASGCERWTNPYADAAINSKERMRGCGRSGRCRGGRRGSSLRLRRRLRRRGRFGSRFGERWAGFACGLGVVGAQSQGQDHCRGVDQFRTCGRLQDLSGALKLEGERPSLAARNDGHVRREVTQRCSLNESRDFRSQCRLTRARRRRRPFQRERLRGPWVA